MPIRMYDSSDRQVEVTAPPIPGARGVESAPVWQPVVPFADSAEKTVAAPRKWIETDYIGSRADSPRLPSVSEQSTFREVPKGYEVRNTTPFSVKAGK